MTEGQARVAGRGEDIVVIGGFTKAVGEASAPRRTLHVSRKNRSARRSPYPCARQPSDGGPELTIPALIFGVAAASSASGGAAPFLTPFLMLCALSPLALALAPVAAAALRHARE
jgi:hypothetical protein